MTRFPALFVVFACAMLATACGGSSPTPPPPPPPPMPLVLTGNTTTLAGDGTQAVQDSTDGTGATAQFNFPRGLATDGTWLYSTESTGDRVRRINPTTGETTIIAGDGSNLFADGIGTAAGFIEPRQIVYAAGSLYLCDYGANRIRQIDLTTLAVTTLAGDGMAAHQDSTDGTGATAQFNAPTGITTDGAYLYVSDSLNNRIRRVDILTGDTTTVAGDGTQANTESTDGTGATASFDRPIVLVAVASRLYVGNASRIFEVDPVTGNSTFFAGSDMPDFQDSTDGTGATARFGQMLGIGTDGVTLFVGDIGNNLVRRVVIATGETTTLAGDGTVQTPDPMTFMLTPPDSEMFRDSTDGTGATARLFSPRMCLPLGGVVYVADGNNHRIRKIE